MNRHPIDKRKPAPRRKRVPWWLQRSGRTRRRAFTFYRTD